MALTRNKDCGQTLVSRTKPGQNFQLLMLGCVYAMRTDENVCMCVCVCVYIYIYRESLGEDRQTLADRTKLGSNFEI